jgi:hypothetical protein
MKHTKLFLLHPFFFAIYPSLVLIKQNIEEIRITAGFQSLIISLIFTALLLHLDESVI